MHFRAAKCDQVTYQQLAQEEEDTYQDQQQREAEEQCREVERKKPKINDFHEDCEVSEWSEPRATQYALNKINNLKYIELDYFTIKGCHDAAADMNKSISQDTLAFTQVEGNITICPLAAICHGHIYFPLFFCILYGFIWWRSYVQILIIRYDKMVSHVLPPRAQLVTWSVMWCHVTLRRSCHV